MQAQVDYGLKNTALGWLDEIQAKYNKANRRAIRAIMRAPIYVANEAIEMELGVKKITDLYKKSVLIEIGKTWISADTLHGSLMRSAIRWRTPIINSWRMILGSIGISYFEEISMIS